MYYVKAAIHVHVVVVKVFKVYISLFTKSKHSSPSQYFPEAHVYGKTPSVLYFVTFLYLWRPQVVEDGYEFFAKRQLVTLFSAPNYCGEFDNAGGMMSVDETLMCSFQVRPRPVFESRFFKPHTWKMFMHSHCVETLSGVCFLLVLTFGTLALSDSFQFLWKKG